MPELPDIIAYVEALEHRIKGRSVQRVRLVSPFLMRSFDPPVESLEGCRVNRVGRLGKRIVLFMSDELFVIIHLMIAGRLRWSKPAVDLPAKIGLAAFDFQNGSILITEAGSKKRASLHVIKGEVSLALHDPGGIDVLESSLIEFQGRLLSGNHTLKRALTDPRSFSGIGNAYSDEILHEAQLSPIKLTHRLTEDEVARLHVAAQKTLTYWINFVREDLAGRFPSPREITAFREGFAVHGRYGKPCPVCDKPVQRIRYAQNETDYCARCQTQGRVLADRSLSRLLRADWPSSIDELG